ncbi:3-oxoacyl-[acyl-carrier-protein] synthase 3 A, chloroplastic-like protein [Tanacetum coccineum]
MLFCYKYTTRSQVQKTLGCKRNPPAYDIRSACSGFILGLVSASCHIRGGGFKNVLVIGADCISRYVDWTDRKTCVLFGDAAGAVLVQACDIEEDGLFGFDMHTDGDGSRYVGAHMRRNETSHFTGGSSLGFFPSHTSISHIQMNGQEVFRFVVKVAPQTIEASLANAGLRLSEIDWLLANQRIIDCVTTKLKFPKDRVISNLGNYGNTSAASIPLALDEAVRSGNVKEGPGEGADHEKIRGSYSSFGTRFKRHLFWKLEYDVVCTRPLLSSKSQRKNDAPDLELSEDLSSLYNKGSDVVADPDVLKRLVEKLQLTGINDLTNESITLHEMVSLVTEIPNPNAESPPGETSAPLMSTEKRTLKIQNNTILPDDFRCPISLELMKDPVIVSIGQGTKLVPRHSKLGAIPHLVLLLSEGTQRGKKDVATTLFNLCIYQEGLSSHDLGPLEIKWPVLQYLGLHHKGRAVRAGVITTLMELLTEPQGAMKDEALAILAILSGHPEAKIAIGKADAVRVLVDFIASGSPRNKENAAAVMVHLFSGDQKYLVEAQELGVMGALVDLLHHGTDRGKRKAGHLLEKITRYTEQQKLPHLHAETESNN